MIHNHDFTEISPAANGTCDDPAKPSRGLMIGLIGGALLWVIIALTFFMLR